MIKSFNYIKLASLFIIPIILLILPATYFDTGESICVSKVVFNIECYGCGMTRAMMHLIHFNFKEAWDYNKISYLVLPVAAYMYAGEALSTYKKLQIHKNA